MNEAILHTAVQKFICENLHTDIPTLLFQKSPFDAVTMKELAEQIEAKMKSKKKLPTWFSSKNIYYANKGNISQTSSELTAAYKADIVSGDSLADLTAGFGVDTHAFSKKVKQVYHIEKNQQLSKIARSNFERMTVSNINCIEADGIDFLGQTNEKFHWIYVDPSRRTNDKEKVYFLSDCEPDITLYIDLLFSKTDNILIKTGPLLDISVGISQLRHVKQIHIVALENDVKEVLWVLEQGYKEEPIIKTINIKKDSEEVVDFFMSEEKIAIPVILPTAKVSL